MNIIITGASGGVGAALAKAYAAPGVTLGLCGRDSVRLEQLAEACRKSGAGVNCILADVADKERMNSVLNDFDKQHPVDLVIANAGVSAGTGGMVGETEEQARRLFAVNLEGVLNTIYPLMPHMRRRGRGQIAIMSSLAGLRGMPGAPAYSASKGAVRLFGEALRTELSRDGIAVSVICPGFIKTPMTAVNPFPMPFLMEADSAAARIKRDLDRKKARIAFPWPLYAFLWILGLFPQDWGNWLMSRLPAKPPARQ